MKMAKNYRFSIIRVFWVILALNLFAAILLTITYIISPISDQEKVLSEILSLKNILVSCAKIVFHTIFFYFTINWFYELMVEKKGMEQWVRAIAVAILMLAVYYVLSHFFWENKKFQIEFNDGGKRRSLTTGIMIMGYFLGAILYIIISLLIAYFTTLRDEKKKRKILEAQKLQLEIEKSQANFNFLKAQINPHFLHNTLNFLYAKSLPYSPELSEGILTLSDIMRYALSEGNATDGKAPLKDEVEHVRNVIKINQLRFSHNLKVDFEVEGVLNNATIIPFVLITLVENAFKHGDVKSTEYPISILLRVDDGKLYFMCRNKKKTGPKELSTGIGLDNIRKRLDLAYGENYRFHVKDEAEFYTTELTILKL
jgi:two-component system, LytTR family, sensor kinase